MAHVGVQDEGSRQNSQGRDGVGGGHIVRVGTRMRCWSLVLQTPPRSVLEAGASGVRETLSLPHRAPHSRGRVSHADHSKAAR